MTSFELWRIRILNLCKNIMQRTRLRILLVRGITKIIIGCGHDVPKGWVATDIVAVSGALMLDVTNPHHWERFFETGSLTHILSEHMFEHLNDSQIDAALELCRQYLSRGGRLRIAVPDANRKDAAYVEEVAPPADGHLQYFTIYTLEGKLTRAGFSVERLEYYDENGVFHKKPWDSADGFIKRSYEHDSQKEFAYNDHYYTSIIVDAVKRK